MSLVFKEKRNPGTLMGIWRADEDIEDLLSMFTRLGGNADEFKDIHHDFRKKQMLCMKILAGDLLGEGLPLIHYKDRAPELVNSPWHISVSHSGELVGVMVSQTMEIGLDIEKISGRIEKIAHRFLHPDEQQMLTGDNRPEQLLLMWCAKEALFKLYKKGGLDFKENIRIKTFDKNLPGRFSGSVQKGDEKVRCSLYSRRFEKYIIVYAVNE